MGLLCEQAFRRACRAPKLNPPSLPNARRLLFQWWVHSTYAFALPIWMTCAAWDHAHAGSAAPFRAAAAMVVEACRCLLRPVVVLSTLSFVCGYTWFWSLVGTNVPTNNTLYQTQCAFVFVLSVLFLGEKATRMKVVCVVVAFAGVACVCAVPTEGDDKSNAAWGIALALASTACYATYEVAFDLFASRKLRKVPLLVRPDAEPLLLSYQKQEEQEGGVCGLGDERDGLLILGIIGVVTLVLWWLPLPLLSWWNLEKFVMPSSATAVKVMTVGFSDLVFNGFLVRPPILCRRHLLLLIFIHLHHQPPDPVTSSLSSVSSAGGHPRVFAAHHHGRDDACDSTGLRGGRTDEGVRAAPTRRLRRRAHHGRGREAEHGDLC